MLLLAECVSAKPLPDLRQPHGVARRVRLSQTAARSTSAAWCRSQSASQPNRGPIHVSRMLLLAECTPPNRYLIHVSYMLLLAECTPPNRYLIHVSRMLLLAECTPPNRYLIYVSRMLLLTECTPPNRYLIYVSRMLSLTECVSVKLLSDLRQPHNVIRRVRLSQTVA